MDITSKLILLPSFGLRINVPTSLAAGYLAVGRDLRRLEANNRSPLLSGFSDLLEGITTVRSFSAEKRFLNDFHHKVDITTTLWHNTWMTNRW